MLCAARCFGDLIDCDRVWVANLVEQILQLTLFGCAIGVDDRPECRCLGRRRLRIERRDVERGKIRRDVAVTAVLVVPAPYSVPVTVLEVFLLQLGPYGVMPPVVGGKQNTVSQMV